MAKAKVSKLDVYLADLLVGNVKLHNLHWNVEGFTFKAVHEYLEALYDQFFEYFDEVAEYQKQVGIMPKASVKEYLELTDIEELSDKIVDAKVAIKTALELIKHMKEHAIEIREEADEKDEFVLVGMMEDHVAVYNKEIWFMESMLKEN